MSRSDRSRINSELFNVIKRVIDQEAPQFRDSPGPQQQESSTIDSTSDLKSLIKKFISDERMRNPPVESSKQGNSIDEQYLRELIRQVISDEYRPDPNDPDLREAIKQVLAEESTQVEERHAEIAFKEKKTVVRPEESLTSNDRNEIDFYSRSPGIGAFVLTVTMLTYGIFPKQVPNLAQQFQSKLDANEDEGIGGGDTQVEDSDGDSGVLSGVQSHIVKVLAVISPFILTAGQFTYVFYIFRRSYEEITFSNAAYDLCPGHLEGFRASVDIRVIMGFISAFFVVKNVQTLSGFLSALKGRSEGTTQNAGVEAGKRDGADEEDVNGGGNGGKMKNVRDSWIFPFYALDCMINLCMTYFVLICNLYTVFVSANTPHEMISKTVVLNFIFEQLPAFKRGLLDGKVGKGLLAGLRAAHRAEPRDLAWRAVCQSSATVVPTVAQALSVLPILFPICMAIYGPICKPGLFNVVQDRQYTKAPNTSDLH